MALAAFFVFSFIGLSLALVYWMVVRGFDLGASPSNPRVVVANAHAIRGEIVAADGTVLAQTDPITRQRRYRLASLSNVIGYSSARYGQADLELTYNAYLAGRAVGNPFTTILRGLLHEPIQGANLQLTIVPSVQQVADQALGSYRGAIIAMRPSDGAVLALVSKPDFDPNHVDQNWATLSKDPQRPLLNRATQGLYPPGSTFKLVTNSAVLETGLATPSSTFTCIGDWVIQGFHISCENPQIPQRFNLVTALDQSSNATYARLAVKLGQQRFEEYARRFGIGSRPPFDLPVAVSHVNASKAPWSNVLLATSGFGQGDIQVSPLQMALVVDAIANGGQIVEPYLVQSVRDRHRTLLYVHQRQPWRTAISAATAATDRAMMQDVVDHGSGFAARIPGVTVGGKTGTAQVGGTQKPHAWFVCFAPVQSPKVVVVVLMENAGEGATVAGPAARLVLQAALAATGK